MSDNRIASFESHCLFFSISVLWLGGAAKNYSVSDPWCAGKEIVQSLILWAPGF